MRVSSIRLTQGLRKEVCLRVWWKVVQFPKCACVCVWGGGGGGGVSPMAGPAGSEASGSTRSPSTAAVAP